MVTRRDLGFLIVGGGGAVAAASVAGGDADPRSLVDGGMSERFTLSSEFARVEWRDDGQITIETEPDAEGESLILAPGDVTDPISGDYVSSSISQRAATVQFGLGEAIRKRGFERISIGSYRLDRTEGQPLGAERLDVVTVAVPEDVRANLGV